MRLLGYPKSSSLWIKSYYSIMLKLNKKLIAKAFMIPDNNNLKYIILVAINAYSISINNPDIILIIQ